MREPRPLVRPPKLMCRTVLKLNAYYAYPALSNGDPVEPYTSTCLASTKAVVALCTHAREIGFAKSSSPLFVWSSWVAARVLFSESCDDSKSMLDTELIPVHAFLNHLPAPDDDFEAIVAALKEQAKYWSLASGCPFLQPHHVYPDVGQDH